MNNIEKKEGGQIVTEQRMCQKVALETLLHRCETITVAEAKSLAREISVNILNTIHQINEFDLKLTDNEANSCVFWVQAIRNAGKDFNKKP